MLGKLDVPMQKERKQRKRENKRKWKKKEPYTLQKSKL